MAGYLLYTISFCCLVLATGRFSEHFLCLFICLRQAGLFFTRHRWLHHITVPDYLYQLLPSSFAHDIEDGFTSSDFDLAGNIASRDSRAGLDGQGKKEVGKIMKSNGVGFDEARRLYTQRNFARNNIGPDGRPRDPKFVSFS